jgi:hypothetical protein
LLKRFDGYFAPTQGRLKFSPFFLQVKGSPKNDVTFGRRSIPVGCVAKDRNMLDIPVLPGLAGRAPQPPE